MSRIAYILPCHKEPEAIVAQANRLTAAGDYISIYFDARADSQSFVAIKRRFVRKSQYRICTKKN